MHPRARLNCDCIIGKAPPFLLWLTSGDIDHRLAKVSLGWSLGGEACKVRDELAGILIDFAERADDNGEGGYSCYR